MEGSNFELGYIERFACYSLANAYNFFDILHLRGMKLSDRRQREGQDTAQPDQYIVCLFLTLTRMLEIAVVHINTN